MAVSADASCALLGEHRGRTRGRGGQQAARTHGEMLGEGSQLPLGTNAQSAVMQCNLKICCAQWALTYNFLAQTLGLTPSSKY